MPDTTDVINEVLVGTADQLDVPAELLARADQIYDDIGIYLADNLPGTKDWRFYPQGSSRIGTGVPPSGDDEWDIDAVAEIDEDKGATSQRDLKQVVGEALTGYIKYARDNDDKLAPTGIEEGKRCWTLLYDEPFHLDVLPAVPNRAAPPTGIWLTDRELTRWQPGNPKAYALWFLERTGQEFVERRTELAKAASVSVDDIPTWRVKTTLQRAVQVLKLHRNSFFAGDLDNRPPSCVLTTLAALAYRGERSLFDALEGAAIAMAGHFQREAGLWILENPVEPGDNLADRWSASPEALRRFQPWLDDLKVTLDVARNATSGLPGVVAALSTRFDKTLIEKSVKEYASRQNLARGASKLVVTSSGAVATGAKGVTVKPHTFHGV